MVTLEPEERRGEQEASNLVPAVVEDQTSPVRLNGLARIGVLVDVAPIEEDEPVLVGWEMRRHPVEDDADPLAVQVVDQEHQVLRRSIAAARSEEAGALVSPRSVERVLHHRKELDVGEAEPAHVRGELRRDLTVGGKAPLRPPPGAQMDFVDRYRRLTRRVRNASVHPGRVAPTIGEIPHDRPGLRRSLAEECEGIGLVHPIPAVARPDVVLVHGSGLDSGDETFPDTGVSAPAESVPVGVPAVEVSDDRDALRLRSEDGEVRSEQTAGGCRVGAEPLPEARVRSLVKEVEVVGGQERETADRPLCGVAYRADGHCDRGPSSVR